MPTGRGRSRPSTGLSGATSRGSSSPSSTDPIREYRSADLDACRALYAQLVAHHREIYGDPTIGGDDPGAAFDDYFALPDRVATWVATDGDTIIGLARLLWENSESTIEPVIVDHTRRRQGVGRVLLETAIDESRRRGTDVNIRPVARNADAVNAFHEIGFRTLGHLQLFMSLSRDESYWRAGPEVEVHGRPFNC